MCYNTGTVGKKLVTERKMICLQRCAIRTKKCSWTSSTLLPRKRRRLRGSPTSNPNVNAICTSRLRWLLSSILDQSASVRRLFHIPLWATFIFMPRPQTLWLDWMHPKMDMRYLANFYDDKVSGVRRMNTALRNTRIYRELTRRYRPTYLEYRGSSRYAENWYQHPYQWRRFVPTGLQRLHHGRWLRTLWRKNLKSFPKNLLLVYKYLICKNILSNADQITLPIVPWVSGSRLHRHHPSMQRVVMKIGMITASSWLYS